MKKTDTILAILFTIITTMSLSQTAQAVELQATNGSKDNLKTIMVNNYPIAYIEKGKGEPLLLIHGALSDYRTWLKHVNEFSESNRTIAVSLRHYYPEKWDGRSSDLGIEQDVEDMAAFIKKLKLGKVNLVGHSRGGAVAMILTSKHPELVKRLVLADPSPLSSMLNNQKSSLQELEKRSAALQSSMKYYSKNNIEEGLKAFVNYVAGNDSWSKTTEDRRNILRQNALTLKSLNSDFEIAFTCKDLKKITSPVLIVTGEYSKPIYGQMNNVVSSCLGETVNVSIADAGHMMHSANPTAFTFEVQDFFMSE